MAHSVEHLTSAQVMILGIVSLSTPSGSMLTVLSLLQTLSLSLYPSPSLVCCLSQKTNE